MKVLTALICPECDEVYEGSTCTGCGNTAPGLPLRDYMKTLAEAVKGKKKSPEEIKTPGIIGTVNKLANQFKEGDPIIFRPAFGGEMEGTIVTKNGVKALVKIDGVSQPVEILYSNMRRTA